MRLPRRLAFLTLIVLGADVGADADNRLVFGSFADLGNAERWSVEVARRLSVNTAVATTTDARGTWFRVVTEPLVPARLLAVSQNARAAGFDFWRLIGPESTAIADGAEAAPAAPPVQHAPPQPAQRAPLPARPPTAVRSVARQAPRPEPDLDIDVGVQARSFGQAGYDDQSRFQPSISARMDYGHAFDDHVSFRAAPFYRYDGEDSDRTHFDLREFYASYVDNRWELHVGVRQIFWGVTEFHHLVDVINQTDLVENVDGEDKLGQPMVNLSLVRDWGIIDLFLLTGFRERTFPGDDGRLRYLLPVRTADTDYESGDESSRIDGAIRWVHSIGAVEFGIYHFSGTSRDPTLRVTQRPNGRYVLAPYYAVIDQTAIDAQAIAGDWIFKLEALSRAGEGQRYGAATGGFERTFVGVADSRMDLGLVLEYMWHERSDDADTVFEHDIAFGTRFRFNDVADTQTLLGVIWDHETDEYIVKLEGSRRVGDAWAIIVEGRLFGGAREPNPNDQLDVLTTLADPDRKTASLARDDFLQLELTRYF